MPTSDWPHVQLHVVSGKGGTGKTTVAAALGLALARDGARVLVMEVEGRQGLAQVFDCPPLPYEERRLVSVAGGGELWGLAVDPEAALLDYLDLFYGLKRAGGVLRKMGAIEFVTTIAPGLRDVLLTGKAVELVRRSDKGHGTPYDAIVLDAPPTGRVTRFLNVNTEIAGVAKVGPIRQQADGVMAVLRSARTAVHLVTILEEMPVQETIDGVAELQDAALPVGGIVVNMMRPPLLPADARGVPSEAHLEHGLSAAGISGSDAVIAALRSEAADHVARVTLEETERTRLATLGRPMYELPYLAGGMDLTGLQALAGMLREQGMA